MNEAYTNETKVTFTIKSYEIIEDKNGNLVREEQIRDVDFYIDPSMNAQSRFEKNFPEIAATKEDLTDFSLRMHNFFEKQKKENGKLSMSETGILLKIVFCWFDTDWSYTNFLKLFTFGNAEDRNRVTDKLLKTIDIVFKMASEKN